MTFNIISVVLIIQLAISISVDSARFIVIATVVYRSGCDLKLGRKLAVDA
jgi:hypothetical protein